MGRDYTVNLAEGRHSEINFPGDFSSGVIRLNSAAISARELLFLTFLLTKLNLGSRSTFMMSQVLLSRPVLFKKSFFILFSFAYTVIVIDKLLILLLEINIKPIRNLDTFYIFVDFTFRFVIFFLFEHVQVMFFIVSEIGLIPCSLTR